MKAVPNRLGTVGVWSRELRFSVDRGAAREAAVELSELGYGAIWIPDVGGDVFGCAAELLRATSGIALATGILNIWMYDAAAVAAGVVALGSDGDRFLLGLGASHAAVVDAPGSGSGGRRYERPLSTMRAYLNALDETRSADVGARSRVLAALGPRMLELSRDRGGGAHPYLVTPEHTARARELLGPDRLLAPEQAVYVCDDPSAGRALARPHVADYLALPNYVQSFRRQGFGDDDFAGGGSQRLVDALVAYGDEQRIARRIDEHLSAGADHVCIQVIGQRDEAPAVDQWRRLAPALTELGG